MTFYKWIINKHLETRKPVGDLARDMHADETFPKKAGKRKIIQYLEECGACNACMDAFEVAWKEYIADIKHRR